MKKTGCVCTVVICSLVAYLAAFSQTACAERRTWLPFFADEQDSRILLDRLNADPDIAFIIADGPLESDLDRERALRKLMTETGQTRFTILGRLPTDHRQRWRAVKRVHALGDGHHAVWYRPAGPLPLVKAAGGAYHSVPDPFAGWTEEVPSGNALRPYLGPSSPADIRLELWTRTRPYTPEEQKITTDLMPYWRGDRDCLVMSDFTHIAPSDVWLARLEEWMSKVAIKLESGGQIFWAFPSALDKLKDGMRYEANGFNLDMAIRAAEIPRRH